jgi:5-methyltetrahydropteroyltriglutamate--homocysteine methyltransferase
MKMLATFAKYHYPNQIGPGVFDIHSPRVPPTEEITHLLQEARKVIPDDQLWVNPDCGLKTRQYKEVKQALSNMVQAAKIARASAVERK